ncbi:SUN domain-containing ossification factor isoform X2 [Phlebotomus argentipes]|uniref:SUN domain-containing ossification factor isoform X2 n=1 Tax=Phlebotomus argentipes TaxID=94469 RepID=UPI002892BCDE|nr:SUN domain-containing ossification factor isoform X2 [Phlebotomus argentipes]
MKNTFSYSSCKLVIAALILSSLVGDAASRSSASLAKWTKANKSSEFVSKYGSQSKSIFRDASSIKELLFLERPSREPNIAEGNSSTDSSSSFYTQKPEVVDLDFEKKYGNSIDLHLVEEEERNDTALEGEEDLLVNVTPSGDEEMIVQVNLKPTQPFEMPVINGEENIIPVFSEWTQKQMEEAEKKLEKESTNSSTMKKNATDQGPSLKVKVRAKNYASPDCGAKIIIANPEAESSSSVLSASKDEYLLSPCTSKIWFVVELCEAIRAEKIELANFELYSSSPKDFSISVSNRFPTREWLNVGQFTAKDERNVQKYNLHPLVFGKFIRVEVNSHYSKEHFCPISLFRVYGTSEFEAFETENHPEIIDGDLLDDDSDMEVPDSKRGDAKNNIFKSASDAVLSIVKKAAEVLGKGDSSANSNATAKTSRLNSPTEECFTFAYQVNCVNCSPEMLERVTNLLNCKHSFLLQLLQMPRIREIVYESRECEKMININLTDSVKEAYLKRISYFSHLLPTGYLTALCNLAAAVENHMGLNPNLNIWNDSVASVVPETEKSLTGFEKFDKNGEKIKVVPLEQEKYPQNTSTEENKSQRDDKQQKNAQKLKNGKEGKKIPHESKKAAKNESPQTENGKGHPPVQEDVAVIENHVKVPVDEEAQKDTQSGGNLVESQAIEEDSSSQTHQNATENNVEESEQVEPKINAPQVPAQQEAAKDAPNGATQEVPVNNEANNNLPTAQQSSAHSESVFLRLSNRIKALERNMSLSGQYLEELSKRYKKQVEELQSSFAKALLSIEEQSRRFDEKKEFMLMQHEALREQCEDIMDKICKFCFVFGVSFTCLQILIIYLYSRAYQRISRRCKMLMDCVRRSQATANDSVEGEEKISSQGEAQNTAEDSGKVAKCGGVTEIKEENEESANECAEEVSGSIASGLSGKMSENDVPIEDLNSSELELSGEGLEKSLSNHVESPSRGSEKGRSSFPLRESIARRLSSPVLFKTSRNKSQHSNSTPKSKDKRQNTSENHRLKPKANSTSPEILARVSADCQEGSGLTRPVDEPLIKKTGSFRRILKKVF